jgi:VWFA-related protein
MRLHALAIAGLVVAFAPAQERPVFRATVDLTMVDVSVTSNRRPVQGLTIHNFQLLDNGVPQTIERLLTDSVSVQATLVLDVSRSVAGQHLQQLVTAARLLTSGLRAQDTASLLLFSHRLLVPHWMTSDFEAIPRHLGTIRPMGTTGLYDATFAAVRLRQASNDRGVAVVFTDGYDNASWLSPDDVSQAVERSDIIVYGVTTTERWQARVVPYAPQDRFLRDLAQKSGGAVFYANWDNGLEETFRDVLDHIRGRYVLAYSSRDRSPGWHRVEVRLVAARGDVVARRGYELKRK